MIKGTTVQLAEMVEVGTDELSQPVFEEVWHDVKNVIVAPASSDDIVDATKMYGKKTQYVLGIPKGDTHNWTDTKVRFFGKEWRTFGVPTEGIETMIPLSWNKKVMVEWYG